MKKIVFLISGKLQSGKNKFGDFLFQEIKNYTNLTVETCSFAEPVKSGAEKDFKNIFNFINDVLVESINMINNSVISNYDYFKIVESLNRLKILKDNLYENKTTLSRMFLQVYGTEIFRNRVDDNYWVKRTIENIKKSSNKSFIITDVRFPNELELMKSENEFDVITIRIERNIDRQDLINEHPSEKELDGYIDWNYIVKNNGTLEQLRLHSKRILTEYMDSYKEEQK